MGLLSKFKNSNDDYKKALKDLNEPTDTISSRDKIIFEQLENGKEGGRLALKLLEGNPLVLNFELIDIDDANMLIAFLSGVIFTNGGEVIELKPKIYLFARKQDFLDGSLREFMSEI